MDIKKTQNKIEGILSVYQENTTKSEFIELIKGLGMLIDSFDNETNNSYYCKLCNKYIGNIDQLENKDERYNIECFRCNDGLNNCKKKHLDTFVHFLRIDDVTNGYIPLKSPERYDRIIDEFGEEIATEFLINILEENLNDDCILIPALYLISKLSYMYFHEIVDKILVSSKDSVVLDFALQCYEIWVEKYNCQDSLAFLKTLKTNFNWLNKYTNDIAIQIESFKGEK